MWGPVGGERWAGAGGRAVGPTLSPSGPPPPHRNDMVCVCVRECGPEAPDVTPTTVPKECGYGNFTRRSRTGSVVVCVAPSPARGSLWHKPLTHRVGLATCLAGVGHTPIASHPPPPCAAAPPPSADARGMGPRPPRPQPGYAQGLFSRYSAMESLKL